jgi:hypothetical protein
MKKNKVVKFIDGVANITMTRDLTGIVEDKVTVFVNPILTHLRGVPPELWTVSNSQIVEIKDPKEREERIKMLGLKAELIGKGSVVLEGILQDIEDLNTDVDSLEAIDEETREWIFNLTVSQVQDVYRLKDSIHSLKQDQERHIKHLKTAIVLAYLAIFFSYIF